MKLEPHQRVPYPLARDRALSYLLRVAPTLSSLAGASFVAQAIWPNHQMTAQGAGAAASRVLKRMQREGLTTWHTAGPDDWGYCLTSAGRIAAQNLATQGEKK